jgi:hypothetical protein
MSDELAKGVVKALGWRRMAGMAGLNPDIIRLDERSLFEEDEGPPPVDENGRRYLSDPQAGNVERILNALTKEGIEGE